LKTDGSIEGIIYAALAGVIFGVVICSVILLFMLPGLSPKRMSRNIQRVIKLMDMSESEQEQLGREMLEAEIDPARVLDYKYEGPSSKNTPARFILSPNYACLWGGYPLVILLRLSDIADITVEEERKTAVAYGAKSDTVHGFHLHSITFYYKGSTQGGDNAMGFFSKAVRDKVFDRIQSQRIDSSLRSDGKL
jgi:hypothetical protein